VEPRGFISCWAFILSTAFIGGSKGTLQKRPLPAYAIAGRSIPFFAFLLAATAASFSGWTFIGHPGLIWRDGLAYAFASFYVLTIPITGTFFSKRTWLLGKRYGFITPGDMYAYYFNSRTAALFGGNYSGALLYVLLSGSADGLCGLFNVIAGVPVTFGAIFMAFIVWFYVCTGGLKASTWVGVIQFILLVGGIVILGLLVVASEQFGGWSGFSHRFTHWMPSSLKFPG
jgi:SSS family solute:Na+ symporter